MAREFRFPVDVAWEGDRLTTAYVAGKEPLSVATPPEFKGTTPDVWSPEDLFAAAAASCLAVTIAALADQQGVPLVNLDVRAEAVVGRRPDGRFGFSAIEQEVRVEIEGDDEAGVRALVAKAEETCLVAVSVDLPVTTTVEVRTTSPRLPVADVA
jgi:organic hydroperoxide reductase OsmC/OhrA